MAGNAMGALTVKVGGADYRLWLGFSVLADVQAEMPAEFAEFLANRPFNLAFRHRLLRGALERFHPEKATDRWFVDEMVAENPLVFTDLLESASPSGPSTGGKAQRKPPPPR